MNLNYTGLKLEDFPEEVQRKYAFPKQEDLERYMRQEQGAGRELHTSARKLAYQDFLGVAAALSIGSFSYVFYNLPAGKVIRDRIRSQMPFPKRILASALPFLALSTAFFIARRGTENKHQYRQ